MKKICIWYIKLNLVLKWLFCSQSLNIFLVFCITMTPWTNSLKLRSIYFGYVVHNDIPPSSHSTKALNLVTPSSIEILWQLVIKWENGPGPVLSRRFLYWWNTLCILFWGEEIAIARHGKMCKLWFFCNHTCNEVYKW